MVLVTRRPTGRLYYAVDYFAIGYCHAVWFSYKTPHGASLHKKRTALVGSPLLVMMVDVDAYSAR